MFFNFSRVFNTIQTAFCEKLQKAQVDAFTIAWMTNYLTNRPQFKLISLQGLIKYFWIEFELNCLWGWMCQQHRSTTEWPFALFLPGYYCQFLVLVWNCSAPNWFMLLHTFQGDKQFSQCFHDLQLVLASLQPWSSQQNYLATGLFSFKCQLSKKTWLLSLLIIGDNKPEMKNPSQSRKCWSHETLESVCVSTGVSVWSVWTFW